MKEVDAGYRCRGCGRAPKDIDEYVLYSKDYPRDGENVTPDEFVRREEGTFDSATGTFYCTACYVAVGCPTTRGRR